MYLVVLSVSTGTNFPLESFTHLGHTHLTQTSSTSDLLYRGPLGFNLVADVGVIWVPLIMSGTPV